MPHLLGFQPLRSALVMLAVALACVMCRRRAVSVDDYCTAVLVVIDPTALVTASFWLYLGTVEW